MLAMPAWMVLSYYTRHAHLVIIFPLALSLSVVAGYDQSIDDFLSLSRIIVFFPFYLLGFRLNADNLSSVLKRAKLIVIPSILILLLFAFCCYRYTDYLYQFRAAFVARFPYSEIPIDGYGATERFLYYALSFLLTACTISIPVIPSPSVMFAPVRQHDNKLKPSP